MIRSIIIEDEYKGQETLINYLRSECYDIEIIGQAANVEDGISLINTALPELVFLDINLPDGSGFDILEKVKNIDFELIFVTAYDHYAIDAIKKTNCIDYLVKPISIEELRGAVEKVKAKLVGKNDMTLLQKLERQTHKITVPTFERFEIIEIGSILYCESDRAWTTIYMENNVKITCSKNLSAFEKVLMAYNFLRTHKSFIINMTHLKGYIKGRGGIAILSNNKEIPVSEAHRLELMKKLNIVR